MVIPCNERYDHCNNLQPDTYPHGLLGAFMFWLRLVSL